MYTVPVVTLVVLDSCPIPMRKVEKDGCGKMVAVQVKFPDSVLSNESNILAQEKVMFVIIIGEDVEDPWLRGLLSITTNSNTALTINSPIMAQIFCVTSAASGTTQQNSPVGDMTLELRRFRLTIPSSPLFL